MLLMHQHRPPASRFSICGFSRSLRRHSEHQTRLSPTSKIYPSQPLSPFPATHPKNPRVTPVFTTLPNSSIRRRMLVLSEQREPKDLSSLSPAFATDPKIASITRLFATLPNSLDLKSFVCHTSEKQGVSGVLC